MSTTPCNGRCPLCFLTLSVSMPVSVEQMKAPWKTLQAHDYDDNVKLLLPRAVLEPPAWAKLLHHSGGSSGGGVASSPVPQVGNPWQ